MGGQKNIVTEEPAKTEDNQTTAKKQLREETYAEEARWDEDTENDEG